MMPSPKTYASAGAFRKALEERLKRASLEDQVDLNRLRRQVSFDRLLARLFWEEPAPWVLKGGYALELRFKTARSTVDIDLTLQRVVAETSADGEVNQVVREMLQRVADIPTDDWFEYAIGPPIMDLTAAPYGGARYPVEARMPFHRISTQPCFSSRRTTSRTFIGIKAYSTLTDLIGFCRVANRGHLLVRRDDFLSSGPST